MANHELEQRLMRRLVDGLAGWATYYQASASGRHYDEHVFYQHLEAIASGRQWKVWQQAKVAGHGAKGAPSSVDFVFYRRPGNPLSRPALALVEVKYLRGDQPSQDLRYLWEDVEKLRKLQVGDLEDAQRLAGCGDPAKFLLILGQERDLNTTSACKPRAANRQKSRDLLINALAASPPVGIYWAEGNTYLRPGLTWRVMAIGSRRWPK